MCVGCKPSDEEKWSGEVSMLMLKSPKDIVRIIKQRQTNSMILAM